MVRRRIKSSAEVYDETIEQIASARRRNLTKLFLGKGRRALARIPPLSELPFLQEVIIDGTSVSDLSPVEGVPNLQRLAIGDAPVASLEPLTNLNDLRQLHLHNTEVRGWNAIARLPKLEILRLDGASHLEPDCLRGLKNLRSLTLADAPVTDLNVISGSVGLLSLWLESLPATDLSPLASLKALRRLSIEGLANPIDFSVLGYLKNLREIQISLQNSVDLSSIAELSNLERLVVTRCRGVMLPSSLAKLERLEVLSLYDTDVADLQSIRKCSELKTLIIRRTPIEDISPVSDLARLEDLGLDSSQVRDLTPVAGLASLVNGAKDEYRGISFARCPLADEVLLKLSEVRNPDRTTKTLNYLRSKMGLALLEDIINSEEADWKIRALGLMQSPLGVRFEAVDEYLAISNSGQNSDREAANNHLTQQLYEQIKIKSDNLIVKTPRLANTPEWQSLSEVSARFNELMQAGIDGVVENIGLVWAELVSLGSFIEQDDDLRLAPNAFGSPLDADIRRPLVDLLQTAGPWIRRFPSARELDEDHSSFQSSQQAVRPALEIMIAAEDEAVVAEDDIQIVEDALHAGERSGVQSHKARSWGLLSVRNLVVGAMGVAAAGMVSGITKEIGIEVAQGSPLANKAVQLIISHEQVLLEFLSSLPADIRSTVRSLLDDLKSTGGGSEFPLPNPPQAGPSRRRRVAD